MSDPTYVDLHVHTHFSPCGKREATAEAMLRRAAEKGFAGIGFADHYTPRAVPSCAFYDEQRRHIIQALRAEIERSTQPDDLEILVGIEADYTLAGAACLEGEARLEADHVVCASSHFHLPGTPRPARDTPEAQAELMLYAAQGALDVRGVSIWAHPFACSQVRPLVPVLDAVPESAFAALIELANAREVAIEINGGPAQRDDYRQATEPFFVLARDLGARFTITSDAHHPDELDRLDLARAWARQMGIDDAALLAIAEIRARQERKR